MSGGFELKLDDGVVTTAGPGDIIVQRGKMHLWRNQSATENCRIVFFLIEAVRVLVKGLPLNEEKP